VSTRDANAITQSFTPKIQNVPVARRSRGGKASSQSGIELRAGNGSDVRIGTTGIMDVAHAEIYGEVLAHLPGIADVPLNAVIRSKTATRQAECGLLRGETLTVAHDDKRSRVVQWVGCSARKEVGDAIGGDRIATDNRSARNRPI